MVPLKVALIHRNSSTYRERVGWWSYPVPEFTWDCYPVSRKDFVIDKDALAKKYDLIVFDDWICGRFVGCSSIPIINVVVDSASSEHRLAVRRTMARQADLILVDSDKLQRFEGLKRADGGEGRIPIYRWGYCFDETVYKPLEKTVDIGFWVWPTPPRREMYKWLLEFTTKRGYSFTSTMKDGKEHNPIAYANRYNHARISVNLSHVKQQRTWRVIDAMAAKSCLVTDPLPIVSKDEIYPNQHYLEYTSLDELARILDHLMETGEWETVAETGYRCAIQRHTWTTRAAELAKILKMAGLSYC